MSQVAQSEELPVQMFDCPRDRKQPIAETHSLVLVRMPKPLKARLVAFSKASYRSLTAEIIYRLDVSLENQSIDEHGVIVVHSPTPLK